MNGKEKAQFAEATRVREDQQRCMSATHEGGKKEVKQLICPLDGKPCEKDCPDRYHDQQEGGCFLTTAQELGCNVFVICERKEDE